MFRNYNRVRGKRLFVYIFRDADYDKRPVWFQLYKPRRELIVLLLWMLRQLPAQSKKSISIAK